MGSMITMTSKGQMTVPKELRDQLNILPGDKCHAWVRNGELVIVPKNRNIADLAGYLGKPPRGAGATLEDFDRAISAAVGEDDERIKREWHETTKSST